MGQPTIEYLSTKQQLEPSGIKSEWILAGSPEARATILSTSADGQSFIAVWECTAGTFRWEYTFDETLHFLEGSVTLEDASGVRRTVGAGDVVFFPKGSTAIWTVDTYIRKLAICRKVLPGPVATAIGWLRTLKHLALAPRMRRPGAPFPHAAAKKVASRDGLAQY